MKKQIIFNIIIIVWLLLLSVVPTLNKKSESIKITPEIEKKVMSFYDPSK